MAFKLVLYCEKNGSCPILEFFDSVPRKAVGKCYVKLERLKELGNKLRRPEADYLRDNIYELRIGLNNVNYRLLYFFQGKDIIVLSHGLTKDRLVPIKEIETAIRRKENFINNPNTHTYKE